LVRTDERLGIHRRVRDRCVKRSKDRCAPCRTPIGAGNMHRVCQRLREKFSMAVACLVMMIASDLDTVAWRLLTIARPN